MNPNVFYFKYNFLPGLPLRLGAVIKRSTHKPEINSSNKNSLCISKKDFFNNEGGGRRKISFKGAFCRRRKKQLALFEWFLQIE